MNPFRVMIILAIHLLLPAGGARAEGAAPEGSGCLTCHAGIEPIRDSESPMMRGITAMGRRMGDPAGCVVCHGGDGTATSADAAHRGDRFYADPGSPCRKSACGLFTLPLRRTP